MTRSERYIKQRWVCLYLVVAYITNSKSPSPTITEQICGKDLWGSDGKEVLIGRVPRVQNYRLVLYALYGRNVASIRGYIRGRRIVFTNSLGSDLLFLIFLGYTGKKLKRYITGEWGGVGTAISLQYHWHCETHL